MKKVIFLLFVLLVSGCSANYNLEISNDSFKENINVKIEKSLIPTTTTQSEIEIDDPITPFLNDKHSALFSDRKAYYKKKVVDFGNYVDVTMKYNYTSKEFKDSNSLNLCFDDFVFEEDDTYYIHAYGTFYCLYTESVNINIKTNNKVVKTNATSVNGNVYTWEINSLNSNNVDIELEVSKGFPWKKVLLYGIITIIGGTIIGYSIFYVYKKNKDNNSIN